MVDATVDMIRAEPRIKLDHQTHPTIIGAFFLFLVSGLGYAVYGLVSDLHEYGNGEPLAIGTLLLLGIALMIALGFEFVNGFHDTANAVATVIYTRSLPPLFAVVWSGFFNFLGVVVSTGAVAYSILTILPVELILQVGSAGGYAMIFALLIAAVIWNLGTWWFGLPNSSSHAMIGSILGVGLANQLLSGKSGTSGVEWSQALNVLKALLFSPICGFALAALLLLGFKAIIQNKKLYEPADPNHPPPLWIRSLLILTCTGVSFAHGGNDGQKGMGVIMLILIGAAPTAYALNRTMPDSATPAFIESSAAAREIFQHHAADKSVDKSEEARKIVSTALSDKNVANPEAFAALATLSQDIGANVKNYGAIRHVPAAATQNLRNDMYMSSEAIRLIKKQDGVLQPDETKTLSNYEGLLHSGTRFIPIWVKVSVAIALGLGTMVGWRRIVMTVGERIGKTHLSYAQGASAEIIAAATIGGAEFLGLPVSTTHILSSGVAGTMMANGSGLQWSTVRNIALAWIMTLPAAIMIAGTLYFIFLHLF